MTLRYRRFLRKFYQKLSKSLPHSPQKPLQTNTIPGPGIKEAAKSYDGSKPNPVTPKVSNLERRGHWKFGSQIALLYRNPLCRHQLDRRGMDEITDPVSDTQTIARQEPFSQDDIVPAVLEESGKRRSTRWRKERTVYDASSGTYVEPKV